MKMRALVMTCLAFGSLLTGFLFKTESSEAKHATLVYFADLHGHFREHPELFWKDKDVLNTDVVTAGGVSRIVAALDEIKKENPKGVFFMDAGDTIQGSAEMALSEGSLATPILNAMNIDLALPGNWEVVYGTKVFRTFASKANYPFVASNIFDKKTGAKVFEPYLLKELNGVRIAIIGFTDPDVPTRQPPSFSEGFLYKGVEVLQPLIDEIRGSKKADAIVLLTHIGLPKAVHLASKVQGVDVILSSDTHERTYAPIVKGETWIVEPGAFGSFLGRLDLKLKADGKIEKEWKLTELRSETFGKNEKIEELVNRTFLSHRKSLGKKIGETKVSLARYNVMESTMDAVLADALRSATGTDIALSNGFRFAYPIIPGPIYEGDLWSVFPINTQLKTGKLTGKQLKDFFEREIENVFSENPEKLFGGWLPRPSGLTLKFDLSKPYGQRVVEMKVSAKNLDPSKIYTVTTCVRDGDPETTLCRIPNGKDIKIMDFDAHEAVRRYLAKMGPIESPVMGRVQGVGLNEVVRSQYYRE